MAEKPVVDAIDGYDPRSVQEPAHARDPASDPGILALLGEMNDERFDAYINELTGVGDFNRDKTLGGQSMGVLPINLRYLSGSDCRDRWRGTDLGGRIVEQIPSEMTREGFELTVQPTSEDEISLRNDVISRADSIASERTRWGFTGKEWSALQRVRRYLTDEQYKQVLGKRRARRDEAAPIVPAGRQRSNAGDVERDDEDEGQAIVEALESKARSLAAIDKFAEALKYERAYGGGAVLLGTKDGPQRDYTDKHGLRLDATDKRNLTAPLDEKSLGDVTHLTALRGGWDGEAIAWSYYNDITSPRYGEPEIYMLRNIGVPLSQPPAPGESPEQVRARYNVPHLTATGGPSTYWVHESRLIIFPGQAADHFARVQMRGWGDPVFMRIDEVLSQFGQTWNSVAIMMQEFALGILKIDGLAGMFAKKDPNGGSNSQGVTTIRARALALSLAQSIARVRMLDKTEDFSRVTVPLTGLAEVLEQFGLRMAAAADMPVSLLFGQSPGGLRAGDDDRMFFYDRVKSKQLTNLTPQWQRLMRLLLIAKSGPTGSAEPKRWFVTPRPLWQPSAKEDAELRKTQAETDAIYLQWGVVTPQEIAASRFGGAKYSTDTVIDLEVRQALAQAGVPADDEPGAGSIAAVPQLGPDGQPLPGQENPTDATAGNGDLGLTPTALSAIVTVNEARATRGLPPWPGADGDLTVTEFQAKRAKDVATAANAELGKVGTPPDADTPPTPPPTSPQNAPGKEGEPPKPPFGKGKDEPTSPQNPPEGGKTDGADEIIDRAARATSALVDARRAGYLVDGEPVLEAAGLKVRGRIEDAAPAASLAPVDDVTPKDD